MSPSLNSQVIPIAEVPRNDATRNAESQLPVVLVVDDERVIADTLAIILSRSGFEAHVAYDGTSALELARAISPDLLVSDVVMPGMTGVELAIALTDLMPACKILLFSGQAATADLLSEARKSGHDFTTLTKPVHPTDLLKRISECLETPSTHAWRSPVIERLDLVPANA